ncbi:MAG: RsbRD N-terminal domain-containing protein [Proteobacteria bacterium]|nr:RsbRD N-terminal domain-containing protein [Pseudomonadota bacterium]
MEAYPTEALGVLKRKKDQFANPLSHIISKNIELLFDELLKGVDAKRTSPILAEIVRIKAVQDFSPSEALQFIFDLKSVLFDHKDETTEGEAMPYDQIRPMEQEIDNLAKLGFNIYVECREKLAEIRVNEIKNQTHMLVRRVNEMDKQKEAR